MATATSTGGWRQRGTTQIGGYLQTFKLIPFPAQPLPRIQITGELERQGNLLAIRYAVTGETGSMILPASSTSPARKHDLWKTTCFEFFLAVRDEPGYWEFNLSPSGDWNVYRMDAYRQANMRQETAFDELPFEFGKTDEEIHLTLSMDLSPILHIERPIQIGIASIIQTVKEGETYWALNHPGPQADFHLRESFVLAN